MDYRIIIAGGILLAVAVFCFLSPYRWWLKIPGYVKIDSKLWQKRWFYNMVRAIYGEQKAEEQRRECDMAMKAKIVKGQQ